MSKTASIDSKAISDFVGNAWDSHIIPTLEDYIRIPNLSPLFDAKIHENGYQEQAVQLMLDWVDAQKVPGLTRRVLHAEGKTPLIFIEVEGEGKTDETVLMYGHLDKQPHMTGWAEGLGPTTPVIRDGKLYGRGGADDGYAIFAAVTSIAALKAQKVPHARIVIVIEGCEESGSPDLPYYIEQLRGEIGVPSLVVCLDSGAGNYEQLWCTSSLRGVLGGELTIDILREGVHSGSASGIVPSTFRILRILLDRIEDAKTGKLLLEEAYAEIPQKHLDYAASVAKVMGDEVFCNFPWVDGAQPMGDDLQQLILNRTWRPTLSYTGFDGAPRCHVAGNVLRAQSKIKLSIRMPPTLDAAPLRAKLIETLESNPPYGAKVKFHCADVGPGWMAPIMSPWLEESVGRASNDYYGKPALLFGEGGSIPLMGMLGKMFPKSDFMIVGVLGPKSNAHGPNEFLHIGMGKGVTSSVASVVADHYVNTV